MDPMTRIKRWTEDRIDWTLLPDCIRREWVADNPQTLVGVLDWVDNRIDWPLLPDAILREWESFKQEVENDMDEEIETAQAEGYYSAEEVNMKQVWKARKFYQDSSLKFSIFNDGDDIEDPRIFWFDIPVSNREFVDSNGDVARYEILGQDWVEEMPELTAPPSEEQMLFHGGKINPKFLSQVILIQIPRGADK